MNAVVEYLGAFGAGLAIDVAWVATVQATTSGRALLAAAWSVVLALVGFAVTALLVEASWVLAAPAALGHGCGTYLAVRRKKQSNEVVR